MDVEAVPTTTGQQTSAGGEQQPGLEHRMEPKPQVIRDDYKGKSWEERPADDEARSRPVLNPFHGTGAGKLQGRVAIITGGDSGIGRAVAVHYAREGAAAITVCYLNEHKGACFSGGGDDWWLIDWHLPISPPGG